MRVLGWLNRKSCMPDSNALQKQHNEPRVRAALKLLLAAVLVGSCFLFCPTQLKTASAEVRADDMVNGQQLGNNNTVVLDAPDINAGYAALCARDSTVLWERNAQTQVPMASTTKIMTALVALEHSTPATPMQVTYGAAMTEGSSADLKEGDTATLKDLLICMMVPSGNDASVAIAQNIAGTEFAFVNLMNEKAAQLGMTGTRYSNVSGLSDEGNYTTASDYMLLTRAVMANDLFREIVGSKQVSATVSGEQRTYDSTNKLLGEMQGVNGVKTGFTDAAGYCLVAGAQRNGFELYAVVFNSNSENQRFVDAEALLEWGFAHYRTLELINSTKPVASLAVVSWPDKTVPVVAASPVSANVFDYAGGITQEVTLTEKPGSINAGDEVGSIVWTQDGEVIARVGLLATETVAEPDFWQGVGIWWQRFIGGFFGDAEHAESTTVLPETYDFSINYLANTTTAQAA
ncbi:MAG TPA: hypothetical protein DEB24_02625 [Coriobacteriia bacterium]|nr:hypothetical protein [Coriobacteriia bacterium]